MKELNPENQPPAELASLFSDFAEDFNTVTLPHKKYYNLEGWEAKQAKKRKAEDGDAAPAAYSIVDDERALQSRHTKVFLQPAPRLSLSTMLTSHLNFPAQ